MTARFHAGLALIFSAGATLSFAGPFAPAPPSSGPVNNGSTAIPAGDARIHGWATGVVDLTRGPREIDVPDGGDATFGSESQALGAADATPFSTAPVVSLGDGGSITLSFAQPIANGPGADFAVFENGLTNSFLELAYVEVSTDGGTWARFPSTSLTPTKQQVNGDDAMGTFGTIDPTDIDNLAGKYRAGFGTPFNLDDLLIVPGTGALDLNNIRYVRVVDVVGWIDSPNPTRDFYGHIINDPWATPYETSGFDLDAIGVLNFAPEPTTGLLLCVGALSAATVLRQRAPRRRVPEAPCGEL